MTTLTIRPSEILAWQKFQGLDGNLFRMKTLSDLLVVSRQRVWTILQSLKRYGLVKKSRIGWYIAKPKAGSMVHEHAQGKPCNDDCKSYDEARKAKIKKLFEVYSVDGRSENRRGGKKQRLITFYTEERQKYDPIYEPNLKHSRIAAQAEKILAAKLVGSRRYRDYVRHLFSTFARILVGQDRSAAPPPANLMKSDYFIDNFVATLPRPIYDEMKIQAFLARRGVKVTIPGAIHVRIFAEHDPELETWNDDTTREALKEATRIVMANKFDLMYRPEQ